MKPTLRRRQSTNAKRVPETSSIPPLFAEGVDVGIELALYWMEQELASSKPSISSVQMALDAVRRLSQQIQQSSFRTALPVLPIGTPRPRHRSSERADSTQAGN